jgi:uroporphyrinogen decarboxylase
VNAAERMDAAIQLKSTDRVPNAPFYEAPICTYFNHSLKDGLLGGQVMAETHLAALEAFHFDWVMVGMSLIGGIIPEALGCRVTYPDNAFPIIEELPVQSMSDIDSVAGANVHTRSMEHFLRGISLLKQELKGQVPIACETISPFTIATRLRGTNEIMEDIYDLPDLITELQDVLVPLDIEVGRLLIEAGVEYIFYGADMECPLLISPDHYKTLVHGPTSRVVNALSSMGGRVLPHMCGDIVKTRIVELLLKMDIQGIMPGNLTQEKVLDLRILKEAVADRVCIFDDLNPNGSLLTGTPDEVSLETRRHLENARSMGGYIFSTAGTTSPIIPRANFDAMNQEVLHFE